MVENERLARIETLVEGLDKKLDDFIDRFDKEHGDHEDRIRSLEKKAWILSGLAAAIGAFGRELMQAIGG